MGGERIGPFRPMATAPKTGQRLLLIEKGKLYGMKRDYITVGRWRLSPTYADGGHWMDDQAGAPFQVLFPEGWLPLPRGVK